MNNQNYEQMVAWNWIPRQVDEFLNDRKIYRKETQARVKALREELKIKKLQASIEHLADGDFFGDMLFLEKQVDACDETIKELTKEIRDTLFYKKRGYTQIWVRMRINKPWEIQGLETQSQSESY